MQTPKATATRQFDGLVLVYVRPDRVEELRALLARLGEQTTARMQGQLVASAVELPFERLRTVHYARLALIDRNPADRLDRVRPMLAFSTNFDGPEGEAQCAPARALDHHVEELVREATPALEALFEHCEGFRRGELRAYLKEHRRGASTFYVGSSGRSRDQILWEAELRRRVDAALDAGGFESSAPEEVREEVLKRLAAEPAYAPFLDASGDLDLPPFPAQPDNEPLVAAWLSRLVGLGVLVYLLTVVALWLFAPMPARFLQPDGWGYALRSASAVGLGLLLLGGFAGALYWRFRHLESTDPQFQPELSPKTHEDFRFASAGENHFLQNQLTHVVRIKPGPLRWLLIRVVFYALQVLATLRYNKGQLGGIPSIHFARWVLIPGRRVLFFSNFDSSWPSYLGDFIDQASSGLTAVWSNTELYPRTKNLLAAGSRDAARFLAWTRQNQLPTQVWYSAYPGLSIVSVNANTEIRRGLSRIGRTEVDATTWLFRLRSVDRVRADHQYCEREPPLSSTEIQGIILHGYGHMPEARYVLLNVPESGPDPKLFDWLRHLKLTSARDGSRAEDARQTRGHLLNVAFSHDGLKALRVDDTLCCRFATPFVQGSHDEYRARVNGDVGASAPDQWRWGGARTPVHVLLLIYAKDAESVTRSVEHYLNETQGFLEHVATLEGTTLPGRKEHFGFRDGIAQPTVQGSGRGELPDNTIAAGEILLGHRDGYGNVSQSPMSAAGFAFGHNGSYLVFRQLRQDVPAFWRYTAAQHGDPVTIASKMVGRWPSGAPLVRHPESDPAISRFEDQNDFFFLSNDQDNDRYGARCPFGAHVRRMNPRDWQLGQNREESLKLSNLHRIIRRGRPYGKPLTDSMTPESLQAEPADSPRAVQERGLQFLCFNTNIERQFEFVQQQWANNPNFAGLNGGPDPVLGMSRSAAQLGMDTASFVVQSDVKSGVVPRCTGLQSFVRVVGSSYFFMPSLPAVKLLGERLGRGLSGERFEATPPDEQLFIDSLIDSLKQGLRRQYTGSQTRRDAHPKMHGCVRARFIVEEDLEEDLRVGLFATPRSFEAWLRFSNASAELQPDIKPDLRGAALKLMGVPGAKLMDGEEHCTTHDFLLVSHATFLAKDVREFAGLGAAIAAGNPASFFLRHPRMAARYLASVGKHGSPLQPSYFSMAAYLFGDRVAKYQLRPSRAEAAPLPAAPSFDFLREALKARLLAGSFSFDFSVQLRSSPAPRDVEDTTRAWSEPFRKVARVEILQQDFDTPAWQVFGENLSFNPWRCLPEHRPLGGISRARRQVYRALSAFRHDRNAAPRAEPTSWSESG
ncbi:MAG: Dyp-type peroxidase [Myxococcales bacterium]|nr:MAG: Dyp-type peroxidase [Myxococcales bacterium]